jgi:glutathione synthase/RimK-type ligase-like ATP-grasp enzyme
VIPLILLIAQRTDPHLTRVEAILKSFGAETIVLDTVSIRSDNCAAVRLENDGTSVVSILHNTEYIDASQIDAVWWRLKPAIFQAKETLDTLRNRNLREREWCHFLGIFEDFVPTEKWVNSPLAQHKANYKIRQLGIAKILGLKIPDTLITNDPELIQDFFIKWQKESGVIYKPLTYYYTTEGQITFTTALDFSLLEEKQKNILSAPGIYQENLQKLYELRVTVVGNETFAVRINSSNSEITKQDWRIDSLGVDCVPYDIPHDLDYKLKQFNKHLGIVYGAYDLVVTKNNEIVFLEVNPSGQWLWLEDKLGIPIAKSIARLLLANK